MIPEDCSDCSQDIGRLNQVSGEIAQEGTGVTWLKSIPDILTLQMVLSTDSLNRLFKSRSPNLHISLALQTTYLQLWFIISTLVHATRSRSLSTIQSRMTTQQTCDGLISLPQNRSHCTAADSGRNICLIISELMSMWSHSSQRPLIRPRPQIWFAKSNWFAVKGVTRVPIAGHTDFLCAMGRLSRSSHFGPTLLVISPGRCGRTPAYGLIVWRPGRNLDL